MHLEHMLQYPIHTPVHVTRIHINFWNVPRNKTWNWIQIIFYIHNSVFIKMKVIWSNAVMSRSKVFEVCYPAASLNHAVLSPRLQRTLTWQPMYNLCNGQNVFPLYDTHTQFMQSEHAVPYYTCKQANNVFLWQSWQGNSSPSQSNKSQNKNKTAPVLNYKGLCSPHIPTCTYKKILLIIIIFLTFNTTYKIKK
jgi:hypothetical protein